MEQLRKGDEYESRIVSFKRVQRVVTNVLSVAKPLSRIGQRSPSVRGELCLTLATGQRRMLRPPLVA